MLHSVAHPATRAAHRAHRKRERRTRALMATIVIVAFLLALLGYFAGVSWHELAGALVHSTYRLAGGYLIGLALGTGIALLVGWSPFTDALFPVFDILQNIPSFAVLPIFVAFMGYSDLMIILFTATGVMWPILFAILAAIRSAHTDLNDAAFIFGARGAKRIPYYLLPLSYPALITGSIVGIAIGWESVIGAELIGRAGGIGTYIGTASSLGLSPALFAGMLGILIVVFLANRLLWAPLLAESRRYAE